MFSQYFVLFLAIPLVIAQQRQCSYNRGDIQASWTARNGVLTVHFTNRNIQNNQWTGMGWGPNMNDLEVVTFSVQNNSPRFMRGRTTAFAPPIAFPNSPVSVNSVQWNGRTLTARFTRPLSPNGARNLNQCMSWKFVNGGPVVNGGQLRKHDRGAASFNVCPMGC